MLYGSAKDIPDQLKHNMASHYAQQYGFPENLLSFTPSPSPSSSQPEVPVEQQVGEQPEESASEEVKEPTGEGQAETTETGAVGEQPKAEGERTVQESAPVLTPLSPKSIFGVPSQ